MEEQGRDEQGNTIIVLSFMHGIYFAIKLGFGLFFAYSTNFVPDEFWQTTEVAYVHSYDFGHLTWEWKVGLRNSLVTSIINSIYEIGKIFQLDTPIFLIMAPQLLQGIITIKAALFYIKFCVDRMGLRIANFAYLLFLMNWFTSYCAARTITNQLEMSLNIACLSYFQDGNIEYFVGLLVINFFNRPTAAIFWIPFIPEFFRKFTIDEIKSSLSVAAIIAFHLVCLDSASFDSLTITPWNFFKFNFLSAGNEEFGVHHPLWYFYSGLPSILGPLVLVLPFGFVIPGDTKRFSYYILFYICVLSYIGHKEIRFLLPILPLVFIVLASVLCRFFTFCERENFLNSAEKRKRFIKYVMGTLTLINIVVAILLGVFHQRGLRAVSSRLYPELAKVTNHVPEVWILTPCYSMPVHTYLHNPKKVNYVYYICPPPQYQHMYETDSAISPLILQTNGFNVQDLRNDVTIKYHGRGLPDWIITFAPYGPAILQALSKVDNATYFPKDQAMHSLFGDFDKRRVVVFQRGK